VIRAKRSEVIAEVRAARAAEGEAAGSAALLDQIAEIAEGRGTGAAGEAIALGRAHAAAAGSLSDAVAAYAALRAAIVRCYLAEQGGDARIDAVQFVDDAIDSALLGVTVHGEALLAEGRARVQQRDDVLSVVSHDLGNPLGAVLMVASSLLDTREGEAPDEGVRKGLQSIHRAASRMRRLVQDLVDFTSIDAGVFSVRKMPQAPAAR
jgi:signal transduction histidine kinase